MGLGARHDSETSTGSDASVNDDGSGCDGTIRTERDLARALEVIARERASAVLALVADCADAVVCFGDVRDVRALTAPGTVNAMGLVSASCGVVDKWRATKV